MNKTSKKSAGFLRQQNACAHTVCLSLYPISGFDNFAQIFNHFGSGMEASNFCKVG